MKKLSCGILAHVDAGKTTLSEAVLYRSGAIRKLGRVDHRDAFLDTDTIERERGITIFSKLASFTLGDLEITLVDTPGHVDFSAEMERALSVMDCAILVISGTDGVQAHTRTLWGLLKRYRIPTFLFVNKMDLAGADRMAVLADLAAKLDGGCTDMSMARDALFEAAATLSEAALDEYLSGGAVSEDTLRALVAERKLFPVYFGSALKIEGVDEFLEGFSHLVTVPERPRAFGARVYKIARDAQGARLTYMKITGGVLRPKDILPTGGAEGEKADQLRLYSGEKFTLADCAEAGTICAVTGLLRTYAGQSIGADGGDTLPALTPVLSYTAILPEGVDPAAALGKFRQLEEEDPQLHVVWNARLGEIQVQLMGEVQLEVVERILRERFDLAVTFGQGGIVYRETITNTVEGVGHFEPLRHYAEVHLVLSPLPQGSGLVFTSQVSEDDLDRNWQRLVLTHLEEKTHLGVLTGSPITDMKITLAAGRASIKHTEGGDFREATYRAVRQGLMQAQSVLLEPWYEFRLEIPSAQVGRAITDITRMEGKITEQETVGGETVLTGEAPVSEMNGYHSLVTAYTRGQGVLMCSLAGYRPCHNAETVIAEIGYEPERDLENTPDSVFCAHGAGYTVKWDEVPGKMHLESVLTPERKTRTAEPAAPSQPRRPSPGIEAQDKELAAIFSRTYGEVKRRDFVPKEERKKYETKTDEKRVIKPRFSGEEYLLVDGYNIIFAWDELKKVASDNLDAARKLLMDILANFRGVKRNTVILVFDAYRVEGGVGAVEKYHDIHVVYTKEAETADTYIEKTATKLSREKHKVYVATSDGPEQMIILGSGALRLTAQELKSEVEAANTEIANFIRRSRFEARTRPVEEAFKKAQEKKN